MKPELYDLVEGHWSPQLKAFRVVQTHKYNVPRAIAYSEKYKLESQKGIVNRPNPIRYKVVPNGTLQYNNTF